MRKIKQHTGIESGESAGEKVRDDDQGSPLWTKIWILNQLWNKLGKFLREDSKWKTLIGVGNDKDLVFEIKRKNGLYS